MLAGCAGSAEVSHVKFKTWQDIREGNVVMQGQDFSCGAAALATMFNYFFDQEISEQAIINNIVARSSEAEIKELQEKGFSFLQLQKEADERGYWAEINTFELSLIQNLPYPIIVYIEKDGFKHFAVLKAVRNNEAFLADPSRGNVQMPFDEFLEEWANSSDSKDSYMGLAIDKKGAMREKDHPLEVNDRMLLHPEYGATRRALFNP